MQEIWKEGKLRPNFEQFANSCAEGVENLIMGQIRNFILTIVTSAKFEYLERDRQEERRYKKSFPSEVLKNDKKFIPILQQIKNNFNDGCKILLSEDSSNLALR